MPASLLKPGTWTLRAQLLASVLVLFTIVMLTTGALTLGFTMRNLDAQLGNELSGAQGAAPQYSPNRVLPTLPDRDGDHRSGRGGSNPRTASAVLRLSLVGGQVATDGSGEPIAFITTFGAQRTTLTDAQVQTLIAAVSEISRQPQRVSIGEGEGTFLLAAQTDGSRVTITGVPTSAADATLANLAKLVGGGTLLGLAVVGVGGNWLIRRNLAPLGRVADTARQVSALKLDSGDVRLPARVAPGDAEKHTEVGQVGAALNTMLDNVEGALKTRQESEMRVRQFVADASHELRTPLASIRGYAELSRRETETVPDSVTHALGRVESEALRMQGLVEDLLLLARLDSGRPLDRSTVDLSLLAMNVVSDAHAASPSHRWELNLPDEPVEVPGDEARLHQVLVNLLANARVHTPEGTRVTLAITPHGNEVEVTVTDNGPGIPADLVPRVFERFTRADDARHRAAGSTGLGLSIVAAVVHAHKGRVWVASEPGHTVFTIRLPAH